MFNTKSNRSQKRRVSTVKDVSAWYEDTLLSGVRGGALEQGDPFWSGVHQDVRNRLSSSEPIHVATVSREELALNLGPGLLLS